MNSKKIPLKRLGFFPRTNPPVFLASAGLLFLFILLGSLHPVAVSDFFAAIQKDIALYFSWVLSSAATFFLLFVLYLLISPYGKIRLGAIDSKPEFSSVTWFAMLFSAGMGIGLVFWSIAEPILHFIHPPFDPELGPRALQAMQVTYFHWGLHAWSIFTVMALALGFFCYRKGLPLAIRSAFYPLLGDRIFGPLGHAIDIFAVVATMFGVATSLGLGVMQINSGLNFILGWEETTLHRVLLIAGITAVATASVMLGLVKGISRLSHFNLWLSGAFLAFMLAAGPTFDLLCGLGENSVAYFRNVWWMAFWSETRADAAWRANWTTFYMAWWVAWAPFVGMFIARISRGRTIRQFIAGCLFGPTAATFLWLSVFGGTALNMEMSGEIPLSQAVSANVTTALFVTLGQLPWPIFTGAAATLVIITFFVTSSDSGSLVIDILTAGGDPDPPKTQRVFWAVTEGVIAAVLLMTGGLKALQTAAISTGFP
ncbi:MAG: BCCT family transporter, partial [Nitrospinaceae bacterium]